MIDQALWILGRGTGITALGFLTLSVVLGIATRSGRPLLTLPRFAVAEVHRFTALAATVLVGLHMVLLVLDPYAHLRLVDFIVPFVGGYRPVWLGLGTLAVELLVIVVLSSMLRQRVGVRLFRALHWATYLLWLVAFAHALGNGSDTGHRWFQLFAAGCALAVTVSLVWRMRSDYVEYADTRMSADIR